ncbi:MAG TPA: hypothetical protein DDY49_13295 [Paenibacillaceae bacterium]|nr:hypothetical protein [Paenibacillaceae bacterium]
MEEFASSFRIIVRYSFFSLIIVVFLWLILPQKVFFQGLMLGIVASMINGIILYIKTMQAGDAAVAGKRARGIGMLQRLLIAGFVIYMSARLPHIFSFYGVLIGLFSLQLITLIFAISQYLIYKKQ